MPEKQRVTSARMVPLASAEAGTPPTPRTAGERVALVLALSEMAWRNSGQPLPSIARHELPVRIIPLAQL